MEMEIVLVVGAFLFGLPFMVVGLVLHFREKYNERHA